MKKYYGPIVLGIAALTVAAPVVNTTVLATDGDSENTTKIPDTTGEEPTSNTLKGYVDSNLGRTEITYNGSETTGIVDATVTPKQGYTVDKSTVKANIMDDGTLFIDQNSDGKTEETVTFTGNDVTATSTLNTNLDAPNNTVTTDEISGKVGDYRYINIPNIDGYYTTLSKVLVHINPDETISSDQTIKYFANPTDTDNNVTGEVTINIAKGDSETYVPQTFNVTGAKGTDVDISDFSVPGYPYVRDNAKIIVRISNDGKTFTLGTKNSDGKFVQGDKFKFDKYTIKDASIDVPKTADYPDGKYSLGDITFPSAINTIFGLPKITGYEPFVSGKKASSITIKDNGDGTYSINPIEWKKISNHSSSNNKPSTKPDNKPDKTPETKPEHSKTISAHHVTFYSLPNTITSLYDENGQILKNRALNGNSSWAADKLMTLDGVNFLRVATNEWAKQNDGLEVTPLSHNVYTKNESRLYTADGKVVQNRALAKNTAWVTDKSATINGQTMYRVATNEWVSAYDLK